ncbi:MAG: hypothetical protein RRC34_15600 [Lentisphaeria bacterium]|nr:hypothetical protein [Lentisphaeria bacterium]
MPSQILIANERLATKRRLKSVHQRGNPGVNHENAIRRNVCKQRKQPDADNENDIGIVAGCAFFSAATNAAFWTPVDITTTA